jgi:hypothetical protein
VVDALEKSRPYEYPFLPPYTGPSAPSVMPGPEGHFDHLEPGTREFNAAHMYGTSRFVLDIWETYFGRTIEWHFSDHYSRLELIPHLDWDNAQSGYGFIETGYGFDQDYGDHAFSLNFDILSHELGHSLIYSVVGVPPAARTSAAYLGFQESASDIITLISTLHFNSVIEHVLGETSGNIYLPNALNRFAELSPTTQIRSAGNSLRMSDVPDVRTPPAQLTFPELHLLGQPLTGAIFDILVEMFQSSLVARGLISSELDAMSRHNFASADEASEATIQSLFDSAFEAHREEFAEALVDARNLMGLLAASAFSRLEPDLTFEQVATAFLLADEDLTGGDFDEVITACFEQRGIVPSLPEYNVRVAGFFSSGRIVKKRSGASF